jgi:hypothetical protein
MWQIKVNDQRVSADLVLPLDIIIVKMVTRFLHVLRSFHSTRPLHVLDLPIVSLPCFMISASGLLQSPLFDLDSAPSLTRLPIVAHSSFSFYYATTST